MEQFACNVSLMNSDSKSNKTETTTQQFSHELCNGTKEQIKH